MIRYFKKTVQDKQIREIPNLEVGSWVNVTDPSSEDIEYLIKKFKLDKRNMESGLDPNELPRLDFVGDNAYIFTKIIPQLGKRKIETYLIVIAKRFILTLSKTEPVFIKNIIKGTTDTITTQKLKCLINLFFSIDKDFQSLTIDIAKAVGEKRQAAIGLREKELNLLLEEEDLLNHLVSTYHHMNLLYERAVLKMNFFEQDKELVEDLITEAAQGFNLCRSSLKTISNIRNYHVVLLSNRLNRIITILTIFTIMVSIPAAISGIYGMNVTLPFKDNPYAFYYLVSVIIITWTSFIVYLRRKRII